MTGAHLLSSAGAQHVIERELLGARANHRQARGARHAARASREYTSASQHARCRERRSRSHPILHERIRNPIDGELRHDQIAGAIAGESDGRAAIAAIDARRLRDLLGWHSQVL